MTMPHTKQQADRQWRQDIALMEQHLTIRWNVSPQGPLQHDIWVPRITEQIHRLSTTQSMAGAQNNYIRLATVHAASALWANTCLLPRLVNSPHRLFHDSSHDLQDDIREERWGTTTFLYPGDMPSQSRKPQLDTNIHPRTWRKWADEIVDWLQSRTEAYVFSEEAIRQMPNTIPAYAQDQIVQNIYDILVALSAATWTRAEQLLLKQQVRLPDLKAWPSSF